MSFAQAIFLLCLLSLPLFLWLIMRRPRRQPLKSSQIFLFLRARKEVLEKRTRFRFRQNLSIIFQVLFLILLSLSAALPQGISPPFSGRLFCLVVDTSLSMLVDDVLPSRFDQAKGIALAQAQELIKEGNKVALWELSDEPSLLVGFTDQIGQIKEKLQVLEPSFSVSNIDLLLGRLQNWLYGEKAEVEIYSDLDFSVSPLRYPSLSLHSHSIGMPISNLAILSLEQEGQQVWITLGNFGDEEENIHLLLNGQRMDSLLLKPMEQRVDSFTLSPTLSIAKLEIEEHDHLMWDNAVFLVQPSRLVVLLVSNSPYLLSALRALGLEVIQVKPEDYVSTVSCDLAVFERFVPEKLPDAPIFLLGPPAENKIFPQLGVENSGSLTLKAHPLFKFLNFQTVRFYEVPLLQLPPTMLPLANYGRAPLCAYGTLNGRDALLFTPSLSLSNFVLDPSFPIFLRNAISILTSQPSLFSSQEVQGDLLEPIYDYWGLGKPCGLYVRNGSAGPIYSSFTLLSEEESNLLRQTKLENLGGEGSSPAHRDLTPYFLISATIFFAMGEFFRVKR